MDVIDRLEFLYNYYDTNPNKIEMLVKEKDSESKFSRMSLTNIKKGNTKSITLKLAAEIVKAYPDIDIMWLTTGKGSMLKSSPQIKPNKEVDTIDYIEMPEDEQVGDTIENSFGNRFEELPNGQYLMYMPLFEWDVQAGFIDNDCNVDHPDYVDIEQYTAVVDKPLRGRYVAFRIKGGSMEGNTGDRFIKDGSIAWGRELQRSLWEYKLRIDDFPLWVIASTDFGRPTLKEIVAHDVEKKEIVCDSWNPSSEYAHNVVISFNTIKCLYYIMEVAQPTAKKNYY